MRRIVEIVSKEEYDTWAAGLPSFYKASIRGTDADPFKDQKLLDYEIDDRKAELDSTIDPLWAKLAAGRDTTMTADVLTLRLKYVFFDTGSNNLDVLSNHELDYIAGMLKKHPHIRLEVAGHTDNVGDPASNRTLSMGRATSVRDRLVSQGIAASRLVVNGYGDTKPMETNDTEEGKAKNRRTELRVI